MSETRVLYLIAELSWKIGDKEEAIRSFSRVIEGNEHPLNHKSSKWQKIDGRKSVMNKMLIKLAE